MSESNVWGTRLQKPHIYDAISPIVSALIATEQLHDPSAPAHRRDPLAVVQKRIKANFIPPEDHLFAYQVNPQTAASVVILQQHPGKPVSLHRDPVELAPWADRWVLGDRLYFPFEVPGPDEPNMAKLTLVNTKGEHPRRGVSVPLGRISIEHADVKVLPVEELGGYDIVDPADIMQAGMEQRGVAEQVAAIKVHFIERPEARSRSAE